MPKIDFQNVKSLLYWSYANLAMADTAVANNQNNYTAFNFMIRARLFKGLMDGSMNIRTLFYDEKFKLAGGNRCSYCGSTDNLAIDHIFPQKYGGKDVGDNLIRACSTCNSSKGKKDLLEWMAQNNKFPPLMILRRYLKLVIFYCLENNLMESSIEDLTNTPLPFKFQYIPVSYPGPGELILSVE